jgi:hypothetical protein
MRTPKQLYPEHRRIYRPEIITCLHCGGPLVLYNYLAWDKTVQTLNGVLSVASRPGHCADPTCVGHGLRVRSAEGQQVALPDSTYGYDVLAHIGWLRQNAHATYDEIQVGLAPQVQISVSQVRYLYQHVYLPLLAGHEQQGWNRLAQTVAQQGGLMLALDGLAPVGGEAQLWFVRELLTGLTLRSGWLDRQDQRTFEAFLAPLRNLAGPVLAVVSDKQSGLASAVATLWPGVLHQFCQAHYLRNLAAPLAEADSDFKTSLRQTVRREIGPLLLPVSASPAPSNGVLTVTGLVPDPMLSSATDTVEKTDTDAVVTDLLRHVQYLLTLKGRPPFRLAGLETYQRLQDVVALTLDLLTHRQDSRLVHLLTGLQVALSQCASRYRELQQGATWLQGIADILAAPANGPLNGWRVAHALRTYLDDLLARAGVWSFAHQFRRHLDKVSRSYWPGLFHCYGLTGLPRTNNDLESHFRDVQRRLLRTTGQQGLSQRILLRTGAWELLPRPGSEADGLARLRGVPYAQFIEEQTRFRLHLARFRLHTRSRRCAQAQFDRLRQRWQALPASVAG